MDEVKAQEIWRVRSRHLIRWMVGEILAIIGLYYLAIKLEMPGASLENAKANAWAFLYFFLVGLWILVPLSVSRAENGSMIADFARARWRLRRRGSANNYSSDTYITERRYNLNNAYDSTMLGVDTVFSIFSILWMLITLIPNMIMWAACQIKNIICYGIVMVPFPFTTFYWYIKSRDKKDALTIGIGVVVLLAFLFGVFGIEWIAVLFMK